MKIEDITNIYKPWLLNKGFITARNKNRFLQDRKFYVIHVQFEPLYQEGYFLNIGVKFLWTNLYIYSFDYSVGNAVTRVRPPKRPGIPELPYLIWYNTPYFDEDVQYIREKADERISEYQRLSDFQYFEKSMVNRQDKYNNIHDDLAIAQLINGKTAEAKELLAGSYPSTFISSALYDLFPDREACMEKLLSIINNARREFGVRERRKWAPIERSDLMP